MGSRHIVAAALLVAVALAGCAEQSRTLDAAEAKDLWQAAFQNTESFENLSAVGIEATAKANGSQVFDYKMQVKPAESGFLFQLSMDRSLMQGEQVPGGLLSNLAIGQKIGDDGVGRIVMPDLSGNLTLRRDHVPDQKRFENFSDVNQAVGGQQSDQNLGPDFGTLGLNDQGENITVEEVTSTTVRGKAAWTIQFSFSNATFSASGELTIFKDSKLPARGSWTATSKQNASAQHPLLRADEFSMTIEFRYGDEVQIQLPDATRAPPVVDKEQSRDNGTISGSLSASHSQEVPLGEIELRITSRVNGSRSPFGPSPDPDRVFFTMTADQGSKSNASYELSYTDADGDGYLSANDTFSATIKDEDRRGEVELHFFDVWSGKYVYQPGFEALVVVAAIGAAVVLARRRD